MADFSINKAYLVNALQASLEAGAYKIQQKAKEKVPRDWGRPPKPLNFKGVRKVKPERKNGVVSKNGKYYNAVSGLLAKSIGVEKANNFEYVVGVRKGPAEKYAPTQEFGDPKRNIPARSFLRKTLTDDKKEIINIINKNLAHLLK